MFAISQRLTSSELITKVDFSSNYWHEIFKKAYVLGASDIHVEPTARGELMIRLRVDGHLQVISCDTNSVINRMNLNRLKELCTMDLSVTDEVQDRSFELKPFTSRYRAILTPTITGESVVMRIINDDFVPSLERLSLPDDAKSDLYRVLRQKQGLICITGPTGSGKSSLLQGCMLSLDREKMKVISLEDPVERVLDGVIHQEISHKLTWEAGIKAAMRQDPDVILIGEVRDVASAALAFKAAQTGHLVLTTLHTNNVAGTIDRFIGLGIDRFLIADNLLYVSAQRLLPKICYACHGEQDMCDVCEGRGVKGRTLLFEYAYQPDPHLITSYDKDQFQASALCRSFKESMSELIDKGLVSPSLKELYG